MSPTALALRRQAASNRWRPRSSRLRRAGRRPSVASSVDPARSIPVQPSERYSSNSTAAPRVSPGYVARLSHTCDCCWAENTKSPEEGAQFKVGQTLHIAAGLVEIVFGCGATAIVEGPAVLELQSNKSSALHIGKLTAHVPDDLEGFTVHTPVAQVVSLCSAANSRAWQSSPPPPIVCGPRATRSPRKARACCPAKRSN